MKEKELCSRKCKYRNLEIGEVTNKERIDRKFCLAGGGEPIEIGRRRIANVEGFYTRDPRDVDPDTMECLFPSKKQEVLRYWDFRLRRESPTDRASFHGTRRET